MGDMTGDKLTQERKEDVVRHECRSLDVACCSEWWEALFMTGRGRTVFLSIFY
jgi:hypothetical protein